MLESVYYLGNEVKYGCNLYVSGWKKLLLHPLQTVKDTAYALYYPIQTGKILLNEVQQHPIGAAVNITLSWATGRAVSSGISYFRTASVSIPIDFSALVSNSTGISESAISSTVSQVVHVGQTMGGGCCGGICTTTAGRIGQTASIITSQSASTTENLHKMQQAENSDRNSFPYVSFFKKNKPKDSVCSDSSCAITKDCSEEQEEENSNRNGKIKTF